MISIESRIEIDRPAREVFAFVADQTNAPRWQDGLAEVRRVTDGPIGVGAEHVFVRRFAGRRIESRNRFTRFEPGRFVQFEVPEGWLTGTASYRVDPVPSGGCRLTSRMDFRIHGPLRVFSPLLARLLARDSRTDEAALKALLEANASPQARRRVGGLGEQHVGARSGSSTVLVDTVEELIVTDMRAQEPGRSPARPASVRRLGVVCLVSSLLGAVAGLVVIAWPAQVTTESYSYPFDGTSFAVAHVFFAVQHLGLAAGLVGLLRVCRAHRSRLGVVGSAVAITGMLVLTGCEVFALTATDALVGSAEATSADNFYGVPMILNGVGLVLAGIGMLRSGAPQGAWRWLVLAMGVYVFVVLFPAVFGPLVAGRLAIAVWMLMFAALGRWLTLTPRVEP